MKLTKKHINIATILLGMTLLATSYQNCAKKNFTPAAQGKMDVIAIATDSGGGQLPVMVTDPDGEVIDPIGSQPDPDIVVINPPPDDPNSPTGDPDVPGGNPDVPGGNPDVPGGNPPLPPVVVVDPPPVHQFEMFCGLDRKSIHNVIDIAQFQDQDVELTLLKGKTLIYSSLEAYSIKSLNIEAAYGRTILCNINVDKLSVKHGRLELYNTEIKVMDEQRGNIVVDENSVLPAGYAGK